LPVVHAERDGGHNRGRPCWRRRRYALHWRLMGVSVTSDGLYQGADNMGLWRLPVCSAGGACLHKRCTECDGFCVGVPAHRRKYLLAGFLRRQYLPHRALPSEWLWLLQRVGKHHEHLHATKCLKPLLQACRGGAKHVAAHCCRGRWRRGRLLRLRRRRCCLVHSLEPDPGALLCTRRQLFVGRRCGLRLWRGQPW